MIVGRKTCQRKKCLVLVGNIIHFHQFHCCPRIFTHKKFKWLKKFDGSECDIVFVADRRRYNIQHICWYRDINIYILAWLLAVEMIISHTARKPLSSLIREPTVNSSKVCFGNVWTVFFILQYILLIFLVESNLLSGDHSRYFWLFCEETLLERLGEIYARILLFVS